MGVVDACSNGTRHGGVGGGPGNGKSVGVGRIPGVSDGAGAGGRRCSTASTRTGIGGGGWGRLRCRGPGAPGGDEGGVRRG